MKRQQFLKYVSVLSLTALSGCADYGKKKGGPWLGARAQGPVIDKTGDPILQGLIQTVGTKFKAQQFSDPKTGRVLNYSLYTPEHLVRGKKYPLVLFMADASTPGRSIDAAITQGYGALVFAEPDFQSKHPCFVLVPEYSGVTVNDSYERTDEVDMTIRLLESLLKTLPINRRKLFTTGQSMGGMMSMYFMTQFPGLFAAGMFVDCHWDPKTYDKLLDDKFIFFAAGKDGSAGQQIQKILDLLREDELPYSAAEWSAKLPEDEQNMLAQELFQRGNPINFIVFTSGSVLPSEGGSEHMYSFDYAYKIGAARDWLLNQQLGAPMKY